MRQSPLLTSSKWGHPCLPRLGRLGSALARRLGKDPLAWASASQRAWIQSAQEVLPFLKDQGLLPQGVGFCALEDRRALASIEGWISPALRKPPDRSNSPASFHARAPKNPQGAWTGCIQGNDRRGGSTLRRLADCVGGESSARRLVLAHEAAHAWQLEHLGRFARIVCQSRQDLLSAHVLACSLSLFEAPNEWPPARQLADLIEETACDAIACWAAWRLGNERAFEDCARFRALSPSHVHRADWLLTPLALEPRMPDDAPEFLSLLEDFFERHADQLFGSID
jgi:hypothetical protein